jgi:hypothetical protein
MSATEPAAAETGRFRELLELVCPHTARDNTKSEARVIDDNHWNTIYKKNKIYIVFCASELWVERTSFRTGSAAIVQLSRRNNSGNGFKPTPNAESGVAFQSGVPLTVLKASGTWRPKRSNILRLAVTAGSP